MDAAGRPRREAVRRQAVGLRDAGVSVAEVAPRLRVSERSVYRWAADAKAGGDAR